MRDILPVVVDGLWRQGAKNLAVRLVSAEGQPLPAWTPGAHIDLHLPCGLIRQYSLTGSPAERDRYLLCIARESQSRGGSRYIHDTLRPGQPLMISAPRQPLYRSHEGGHVVRSRRRGSALRRCWRWPTPGRRPAPALRCTITLAVRRRPPSPPRSPAS